MAMCPTFSQHMIFIMIFLFSSTSKTVVQEWHIENPKMKWYLNSVFTKIKYLRCNKTKQNKKQQKQYSQMP